MAFCKSEEFTVAEVGNSFCNFVLFHYATNIDLSVRIGKDGQSSCSEHEI